MRTWGEQDATVTFRQEVIYDDPAYPGQFLWNYSLTNNSVAVECYPDDTDNEDEHYDEDGNYIGPPPVLWGIQSFGTSSAFGPGVTSVSGDPGWGVLPPGSGSSGGSWYTSSDSPGLLPSETARFSFATAPCLVDFVEGQVSANDPGYEQYEFAVVGVMMPGGPRHTPAAVADAVSLTAGHLTVDSPTETIDDGQAVFTPAAPTTINVVGNDSDPDGDAIRVVAATGAAYGTLSVVGNAVVYTPSNPGWATSDSFTYTIEDAFGAVAQGTVAVKLWTIPNFSVQGRLAPVTADVSGVLTVAVPPPAPPAPPSPPAPPETPGPPHTGSTLVIGDYAPRDIAPVPGATTTTGAMTSSLFGLSGEHYSGKTVDVAVNQQTLKFEGTVVVWTDVMPKPKAIFNKAGSYYNSKIEFTPALFEHERLHLLISEYIAERAAANLPKEFKYSVKISADSAEEFKAAAQNAAKDGKANIQKQISDFLSLDIKAKADKVQKTYDEQAGNADENGWAGRQADWAKNYKEKVDTILRQEGWAK